MFKHYFQAAWQAIRKHRFHSILNILGFSFALAVVILISLYAYRELSTNMWHKDADRIYKVSGWGTPYPLAKVIADGVPEIEAITNFQQGKEATRFSGRLDNGQTFSLKLKYATVDPEFFQIFDFEIVQGNRENPFEDPQAIILTQSTAQRIFGNDDPIGKFLRFGDDASQGYLVTAVAKDAPFNSSIQFDILIPLPAKLLSDAWGRWNYETFAKIRPGVTVETVNKKMQEVVERSGKLGYEIERIVLYPLSDVYFNYADLFTNLKGGNHGQVMAMIWVGLIILLLAIVNFFNLSTASGMMRSKEIGLRKVHGGSRASLVIQFLLESILITFGATLIALLVVNLVIPSFSNLTETPYPQIWMTELWQWVLLVGGSVVVGVIAGSYPAFYLSATDPINALYTGRVRAGFGIVAFRKVLIVFQLVASIAIIACTLVITAQLDHLRNKDLGFDKESILCIKSDMTIYQHRQAFMSELQALPSVKSISVTSGIIGNTDAGGDLSAVYQGEQKKIWCKFLTVDTAFFSTFGVRIKEGTVRNGDVQVSFLLNRAAMGAFGVDDFMQLELGDLEESRTKGIPMQKVSGVCEDFNFKPLNMGVEPLQVAVIGDLPYGIINLRVDARSLDDWEDVMQGVEKIYAQFKPSDPIEMFLLDDKLADLYKSEEKFRTIFSIFSLFAILISCFGLFGLIIFSNARRRKEIGVRRVNGATVPQVVLLLIRSYLVYVAIAFVVAVPVAWYIMNKWLQGYPYHTDLSWWIFAVSGLIALIVVVLTVGTQSWRAATVNPVKSLKSE